LPKPWENKSGCKDPTAYAATRPTEEEIQVGKLVKAVKSVADLFGYEIVNRIEFRNKISGNMYR
jgi:hypothetical protein